MKAQTIFYPADVRSHSPARVRVGRPGRLGVHTQMVLDHQATVYNLAYRVLGDLELAAATTADAVQGALLALSESRQPCPKLCLLRIAARGWQQHLLRTAGQSPSPHDAGPEDGPRESLAKAHIDRPPGDRAQAMLNSLPPDQRVTLVLSDIGGLSYREISEVTGVSEDLIRSHLSRGRAALRDSLLNSHEFSAIR